MATVPKPIPTVKDPQLRAQLTRGVMPSWLFRTNDMLMMEVRQVRPLPRALDNIEIRWGTREDEPLLQEVRRRALPYQRHFDEGCLSVVGFVDGQPASYCWFETNGEHRSRTNGYRFHYGPGGAWVFGFEVKPEYRISGIFHKHWLVAMELIATRQITRVFGSIQGDNPHSLNSHRRLGFKTLCRYRMRRIAGLSWHEVVPEEGSGIAPARGYGLWVVHV